MELLPGGTLKERVAANGPMATQEAVAAVLDIIGGLDAAQAVGVLNRDIKPSNSFIDDDGAVKCSDSNEQYLVNEWAAAAVKAPNVVLWK